MKPLQPGQFIVIPGRISYAQFGCSPKVFDADIKGKRLLVVDKSQDGDFYTLYANKELYSAHAEILVSDDEYRKNKGNGGGEQEIQKAA